MLMMTGDTRKKTFIEQLQADGWGRICVRDKPKPWPGERWGFDNGAYGFWRKGLGFDGALFMKRLERAYTVGTPYIAVVPDIVAGGECSLEFSMMWLDALPKDWPWYLVLQDGMSEDSVEAVVDRFEGLFLGGSDQFKAEAVNWCAFAHKHDKRFHYGRAGTPAKVRLAFESGADSADSAFPLWSQERFDTMISLVGSLNGSLGRMKNNAR
jgi:hypothetical protein